VTDIICPLCGKPNPSDRDECLYCQAPLKASGFLASPEDIEELSQPPASSGKTGEEEAHAPKPESPSPLEQAIPDWLKQTEASFLGKSDAESEELTPDLVSDQIDSLLSQPSTPAGGQAPAIDDEWLASLLSEVGVGESASMTPQGESVEEPADTAASEGVETPEGSSADEEQPPSPEPVQKPEWLTDLEAASPIKLKTELSASAPEEKEAGVEEIGEEKGPEQPTIPDWITKAGPEETPAAPKEAETPIAPAELPGWLEALRPVDAVTPTEPVEDLSSSEVVNAGPLVGLRGVISAHPSAIRARKPPTYSIKLRVTDEQRARVEMMEEMLAEEQKPRPLPSQPILTSRNIFRLVIAIVIILPIAWMIITGSQRTPTPQPGNIPGVVDFIQQVQLLPTGAPVLLAFDYEAGFSGEMNVAISNVIGGLMSKGIYLTLVTTTPSGPALAESMIKDLSRNMAGSTGLYTSYTDLGYIPGGTMGLLGLATSPKTVLKYSLDGNNVWAGTPLNSISDISDFNAVIVLTNDPDTARAWIEQVGPQLQDADTPLLLVTSSQAEPLIRPYYESTPSQVQGLVAGLAGGVAYARTLGNIQQNGMWDAYSVGITISVLIILIGSIAGPVVKLLASGKKMGD
jgi:hypothetical protein